MSVDGYVVIGTELNTTDFDRQISMVEDKLEALEDEYNTLKNAKPFEGQEEELKKIGDEVIKTKREISKLNKEKERFNNIGFGGKQLEGINNSLNNVVKKVTRWGLAVFGVRSAYMAIRSAMSTLSQYDDNLSANIEYIRYALATTLKPIIEWIVNAVYTLLQYINYISMAWFNYNLFQNASVKNFKSMNKGAKELKRTLAGFDEMNILSSNSSSSGGGGGSPVADLSKNFQPPEWLQTIGQMKDYIMDIIPFVATIFAILFKVKKLGLYIAIYGIYKTFKAIRNWLREPTFKNFMDVLQGIALTVAGIAILFGAWPVAIGAAIALAVVTIIKNWDKIKEFFNNFVKWIDTDFREFMRKAFGPIGDIITNTFKFAIEFVIGIFDGLISPIKRVYDGIIKITQGDLWGGLSDIFGGILDIILLPFRTLVSFVEGLWNLIKNPIETVVNKIKKALGFTADIKVNYSSGGGGTGAYGSGGGGGGYRAKGGIFYPSMLPKLAAGGIINYPGPGVPYNGAYIGERGAEAVVPLTDSQQMALLGETIGRYVHIELTSILEADGRTLARVVNNANNNNNFLMNGR